MNTQGKDLEAALREDPTLQAEMEAVMRRLMAETGLPMGEELLSLAAAELGYSLADQTPGGIQALEDDELDAVSGGLGAFSPNTWIGKWLRGLMAKDSANFGMTREKKKPAPSSAPERL